MKRVLEYVTNERKGSALGTAVALSVILVISSLLWVLGRLEFALEPPPPGHGVCPGGRQPTCGCRYPVLAGDHMRRCSRVPAAEGAGIPRSAQISLTCTRQKWISLESTVAGWR